MGPVSGPPPAAATVTPAAAVAAVAAAMGTMAAAKTTATKRALSSDYRQNNETVESEPELELEPKPEADVPRSSRKRHARASASVSAVLAAPQSRPHSASIDDGDAASPAESLLSLASGSGSGAGTGTGSWVAIGARPGSSKDFQRIKGDATKQAIADPQAASETACSEPASKKHKPGPRSRGVASLTPQQLAKKRANDREAQRAIRERQRRRTEQCEQELRELRSRQPYQELQRVILQKEAVEADNADIKRCLASIVALIQPILASGSSSPSQPRPHSQPQGHAHPPHQLSPRPSYSPAGSSSSYSAAQRPSGSTMSLPPGALDSPPAGASTPSITAHAQWPAENNTPGRNGSGQDQERDPSSQPGLPCEYQQDPLDDRPSIGTEKLGFDFLVANSQLLASVQQCSASGSALRPSPSSQDWSGHSPSPPFSSAPTRFANFSAPILNCEPTCVLDGLLISFLHERRQRAIEGAPRSEIVGPRCPSIASLLNPEKSRFSHPISKVFTDILAAFPDISGLPERVAILYVMFLNMRWQVSPTAESYARLPSWLRALPCQLTREHPAWIDNVPFPVMRERLVLDHGTPRAIPFCDFTQPYTSTISLNWPYEDSDTLLPGSPGGQGTDEFVINPAFERHLFRLENWTLGDTFANAFPSLHGTYNLKVKEWVIHRATA